jgi:hypothetical protein
MSAGSSLALGGALLLALQGCQDPRGGEPIAVLGRAIIDGEVSGAGEDGVLLLRALLEDDREVICTGTLVAPNLLLTARHCVSFLTEGLFTCSLEGELNSHDEGAGEVGLHLPAESIEVYGRQTPREEPLAHGQQVISTLSETVCTNDLAFVVLDTALELPPVPMRIRKPAEFGELGMIVGFGLSAGQLGIDHATQLRMRRGGLTIAGVGPDSLEEGVTTVAPRMFIVDGPSACVGDSGGPFLSEATGAVLGVYSLQQGESCAAENVRQHLVHVPPFERLIMDAFAAAGAQPLPEPEATGGQASQAGAGGNEAQPTAGEGRAGGAAGEGPAEELADELDDSGCSFSNAAPRADIEWAGLLLLGGLSAARRAGRRPC